MIEIKYYSKEYEQAHIDFAKNYWKKKRRLTPEYIYWKFRGSPAEKLKSFILAFEGERVVGQFGLIPCQLVIDETIYEAQWACDLMVDTTYRGKGIAGKLYDFAHKSKAITLGSDPSPAAEKSMVRKGYVSLIGPRKFMFPFKIGEAFKLKGINIRLLNIISNPYIAFLYAFKNKGYKLIETAKYAQLNNSIVDEHLHCDYDKSFYDWRFSEFKSYYPGIDCYEKDENNFFSGYYVNGSYYLSHFKVSTTRSFFKMIAFIYFNYKNQGIKRIRFVSMMPKINSTLPFLGFVRFGTLTKVILYTDNVEIKKAIQNKKFNYTLLDSDENI